MRCKFCSAPLPHKGLVCDFCGKRNPLNLGTLPKIDLETKKTDISCPVCNVAMEEINIGATTKVILQRCSKCDGIFVSEEIIEQLLKNKSPAKEGIDLHMLRFIQNNPRHAQESVIRYRKCPVCDTVMQRFNYKSISGVIVDRCLRHGLWLDGGELRQILEWKHAGGESRIREEEKPKAPREKPRPLCREPENQPLFDPVGNFLTWILGGS